MKKILCFILILISTFGCSDFDVEKFKEVYQEQCRESQTVSIEQIQNGATCNGVPLLFALIRTDDRRINSELHKIIRYLVNNRAFKLDVLGDKGLSLLQETIIHGKIKVSELILGENTPFVSKNNKNNSILHTVLDNFSSRSKNVSHEIVKKYDGDLNSPNRSGVLPVDQAYEKGLGSIVFMLIARGASEDRLLEEMLSGEMNPEVLFVNEVQQAREFLRLAGPALDLTYSWNEETNYNLGHFASERNLGELMEVLISSKADLSLQSSKGSPLEIAAQKGHLELTSRILEVEPPAIGSEAVNRALKGGHFKLAELLLDFGMRPGNYSHLVSLDRENNRYAASLKNFLLKGAILDRGYIRSPLRMLVEEGRGAEVIESTGNNVMFTFLHLPRYAHLQYNKSNRKYLSRMASRIWNNWNLVDDSFLENKLGQSLLSYALNSYRASGVGVLNYWNIISSERLEDHWGKVDKLGMVPVHYAFMAKSNQPTKKELKAMIFYGADINHINDLGESLLHMICRHGNYEIARYLLKDTLFGSRPPFQTERMINLTNHRSETPLALAIKSQNGRLVSLLEKYGAKK